MEEYKITKSAAHLRGVYGDKLPTHCRKMHEYLGIDMDYLEKGVLKVSMMKYVDKVLKDFPDNLGKSAVVLAADYLF